MARENPSTLILGDSITKIKTKTHRVYAVRARPPVNLGAKLPMFSDDTRWFFQAPNGKSGTSVADLAYQADRVDREWIKQIERIESGSSRSSGSREDQADQAVQNICSNDYANLGYVEKILSKTGFVRTRLKDSLETFIPKIFKFKAIYLKIKWRRLNNEARNPSPGNTEGIFDPLIYTFHHTYHEPINTKAH
ncbi:hypothetical protein YC2023_122685 [Brassica napus]